MHSFECRQRSRPLVPLAQLCRVVRVPTPRNELGSGERDLGVDNRLVRTSGQVPSEEGYPTPRREECVSEMILSDRRSVAQGPHCRTHLACLI